MRILRMIVLSAALGVVSPAFAGVRASSHLVVSSKPAGTYAAVNLVDSRLDTVWIEGSDGVGVGESFTLDLPRARVQKVLIFPGHGKDERMFKKYGRLKEVSLSFFSTDDTRTSRPVKQQNFVFEDAFKMQEIPVEDVQVGEELFGGHLTVTIRSVYPGKDYTKDTAVAEVKVVLEEWPAQKEVKEVSSTLTGTNADSLIDGSPTTAWVAGSPDPNQFVVLNAPDFGLAALIITLPQDRAGKLLKTHARPRTIKVEIDNTSVEHTLKDAPGPQRIDLPVRYGYTGSMFGLLKITIEDVYPGAKTNNPAIGEIELMATNFTL